MRRSLVLLIVLAAGALAAAAQEPWRNSAFSLDPSRRFDFWVGEWDVNLRIIQDDLTWKDSVEARARIYSILDGKAILELWGSQPIKGYSLRYYHPAREKWVLWLNWPGKNRSGSSSLEGSFRHGRGDFSSTRTDDEGREVLSRYSFNDIGPDSLRWDDAYSKDGGKTWSNQWVMEFNRTAAEPDWPEGDLGPTYDAGERCDREEFRRYEFLAGRWAGETWFTGEGDASEPTPARWRGLKVLGGCALLSFHEYPTGDGTLQSFAQLTYNTYASRYELMLLDSVPGPTLQILYGTADDDALEFLHRPDSGEDPDYKLRLGLNDDGAVFQDFYRPGSEPGSWNRLATLLLKR